MPNKDTVLERAGVDGYNRPKRTPKHPTKSYVVVAKDGEKVKTIRFGKQDSSMDGATPPNTSNTAARKKAGYKSRPKGGAGSFGKMSARFWADQIYKT